MPTVYMLVGLPASGKSTWAEKNKGILEANHISTDKYIQDTADKQDKTFAEVFTKAIGNATIEAERSIKYSFKNKKNLIWDQTNLSRSSRLEKMKMIPRDYEKVCVFFPTPPDLEQRLLSRPGRAIHPSVIESMKRQLQMPLKNEGWDRVSIVGVNLCL